MDERVYGNIGERLFCGTLENGLSVLVLPKPDFSQSCAMLATHYGGAMRRFTLDGARVDTPAGVAHFLEHKMFDMPEGNVLDRLSAMGVMPNAFTSPGMTAYHVEGGDGFMEALRILLDFVSTPYFTEESVEKERGIIGQEIGMYEDDPFSRSYVELLRCLFAAHPIRDDVAGTVESIAQITARTLHDCHRAFYAPSNMALAVIGNVEPEAVAALARELLPGKARPKPEPDYGPEEGPKPVKARSELRMDVSAPQFLIGAKLDPGPAGPGFLRRRLAAALALRALLGRGSRFYTELYDQGLLRSDFSAQADYAAGTGYVLLSGESRDPAQVLDRLHAEVARVAENGLDADYFARCRRAAYGARLRSLEDFTDIGYALVCGAFGGYCPLDAFALLPELEAEECAALIREQLAPERLAMSVVYPARA